MSAPLVSVIMPVYNAAAVLERTLQSVYEQSFEDWEIIAVNDASEDDSLSLLERHARRDGRVRVYDLAQNSGAGIARNKAILEASGRYIAFLDSDDEWFPEKLEKQISWMRVNNFAFTCTAYERIRDDKITQITHVPEKANYQQLLRNNTVGALTGVYDSEALGKIYMPEIRRRQDYSLWLKILQKTPYVYGLDEPLARYHMGRGTLSSNKLKAAKDQWRFYRDNLELNFAWRVWYFCHYAVNASLRNRG